MTFLNIHGNEFMARVGTLGDLGFSYQFLSFPIGGPKIPNWFFSPETMKGF